MRLAGTVCRPVLSVISLLSVNTTTTNNNNNNNINNNSNNNNNNNNKITVS